MKEAIIILDGMDKTGKDTIQKRLVSDSKGKILVINRAFISQIAYNRIYNRNIDEIYFKQLAKKYFDLGAKFVVLSANKETLIERFILHNERDLPINDILLHINIFKDVVNEFKQFIEILEIDTSINNIDETIELIKNKI